MIQVYTGNGKGKTTAALGLAVRAAGAGKKILIAQFLKGRACSELKALKKLSDIVVIRCGRKCFVKGKASAQDIKSAAEGMKMVETAIKNNAFNLVILDEINVALSLKLIRAEEVLSLIRSFPRSTETVLTGRGAPDKILDAADLISEVREIRHYFRKNIKARKGIEY